MFNFIKNMWKNEFADVQVKAEAKLEITDILKKAKTDYINMVFGNCKHGIKLGLCLICCMDEKEPNKMTRLEAVAKLAAIYPTDIRTQTNLLQAFEALSLIKFDEIKEPSPYSIVSKNSHCPNQILAELEYWGYKIVKTDGT